MTVEEFKKAIEFLLSFKQPGSEKVDEGMINSYYEVFKNYDYTYFKSTLIEAVKGSQFFPTPADIYNAEKEIQKKKGIRSPSEIRAIAGKHLKLG